MSDEKSSPKPLDPATVDRLCKEIEGAPIVPIDDTSELGVIGNTRVVDGGIEIRGQFKRDPWASKMVRLELPPLVLDPLEIREGDGDTHTASFHGLSVCVTRETGMSDADVRHHLEYKLFEMMPARLEYLSGIIEGFRGRRLPVATFTEQPDPQWCSTVESDDEHVYGPYATREQALEGAWEHREDDDGHDETATLGLCEFCDIGAWLDVGDLVERLEEIAFDNEWSFVDSEMFTPREDGSKATALREIRESLRRNYRSVFFVMADAGQETAHLPARADD